MVSVLTKPVQIQTRAGWPATIVAIAPIDMDILHGKIQAPAGMFDVRWDASGICRNREDGASLDPNNVDVAEVIATVAAIRERISKQFESAKKLYAAQSLLGKAPPLDHEKIVSFLSRVLLEFQAAGGKAKTGTNTFGERGPMLFYENGEIISYDIGRLLAEKYISDGVFR